MPENVGRLGGHVECLRRRRGDAAGVELGTDPVNRNRVNVGTLPGRPPTARPVWWVGRRIVS